MPFMGGIERTTNAGRPGLREEGGAAAVLEGGEDAMQMGPPDTRMDPERLLPHRRRQEPDDRESIVRARPAWPSRAGGAGPRSARRGSTPLARARSWTRSSCDALRGEPR